MVRIEGVLVALLLYLVLFLLSGCAGTADVVKALAKDPASACVSVSSVYGTGVVGRSNNEKVGVMVEGGRCTISPAR